MDNSPPSTVFRFNQPISGQDLEQSSAAKMQTKFSSLYKNNDKLINKQQQRRNEILNNRLSKRDKLIASIRELVSEVASDDETSTLMKHEKPATQEIVTKFANSNANNNSISQLSTASSPPTPESGSLVDRTTSSNADNLKQSLKQPAAPDDRKFRNKAMLSEWLVDRPMDFDSEWVLKATPVGKRCLVFSRKGETIAYSRTGQFIKAFQSALPGGCHMNVSHCRRQFAIVDCIYVQHNNSFYLMDALAWNEQKLYESEASFRFFWLNSRYNENQEKFLTTSSHNQCRFYCLDTYSASDQDILMALNNDPLIKAHNLQLDGLLFFHIQGPYVPGHNPLVLWIKPDMASRVLNLTAAR